MDLEDDNNTLDYYGVSDGAEILMEEMDATEKDRESKRSAEERDRKIFEHVLLKAIQMPPLSKTILTSLMYLLPTSHPNTSVLEISPSSTST
jgi:hypothetical protein